MKYGLTPHQYKLIANCFLKFSEIEKVILFGSRALGNEKPTSDLDLMICGKQVNPSLVTKLFGILSEEISVPFQFDLLCENSNLDPPLKKHIQDVGVVFYEKHPQ